MRTATIVSVLFHGLSVEHILQLELAMENYRYSLSFTPAQGLSYSFRKITYMLNCMSNSALGCISLQESKNNGGP